MTIRQFDVVANLLRSLRGEIPYLICVQHALLDHIGTRLMAPLVVRPPHTLQRLAPALKVGEKIVYFDPTDLATVPLRRLSKPVDNLRADRDRIVAALDLVFTGI